MPNDERTSGKTLKSSLTSLLTGFACGKREAQPLYEREKTNE